FCHKQILSFAHDKREARKQQQRAKPSSAWRETAHPQAMLQSSSRGRSFANDIARLFVITQSHEYRMTDAAVLGPFGEFNLRHQLGSHPGAAPHFRWANTATGASRSASRQVHEWALLSFVLLKDFVQARQRCHVVTGADL